MLPNNTSAITPDNEEHETLEQSVKEYLESVGYLTCEATYHSIFDEPIKDILQRRFTMTSLYIRGRADRLAIHKEKPIIFEWEVKTHANLRYNDLTIEALPLIHHLSKSNLGVKCLYVFKVNEIEGAFWADKIPLVREIFLPTRQEYNPLREIFRSLFQLYFPNIYINEKHVNGSGDPFIIFDEAEIKKLSHWKDLIITNSEVAVS